jgi:uncharacterized membrane protein
MKIPLEEQYEYLTSHLRYINEKIYQSFTLFIKLATTVVGGVFFLHWKLLPCDDKRFSLSAAANLLFVLISFSMIVLILNNLRSWYGYRKRLSKQYPNIPNDKNIWRWVTEAVMCLVIVITCIVFIKYNPL